MKTRNIKTENEIKKIEKELARMKKNGVDARVISAQESVLEEKKKILNERIKHEEAKQGNYDKDMFLNFSLIDDETLEKKEKQYKVAFVKNNRPIDRKKVDGFINIIAKGKYEKAYPIIVTSAKELIMNGYQVVDINRNDVKEEDADNYTVILDGQHRVLAFLKCSIIDPKVVPNTHMREGKNIGEYLVDINDVGTSWNQKDRFAVAALVTDNELAHEIADRISEGFNPTTASLIYTGKKITGAQVKKLLRGEEWKLPEGANLNIPRGNQFIQLCKEAGIRVKYITKRHLINGFNIHSTSVGEEKAFEHLRNLKEHSFTEKELERIHEEIDFVKYLTQTA